MEVQAPPQPGECLPAMCKAPGSTPGTEEMDVMVNAGIQQSGRGKGMGSSRSPRLHSS